MDCQFEFENRNFFAAGQHGYKEIHMAVLQRRDAPSSPAEGGEKAGLESIARSA
jgi:hypothetical protein